MPDLDATTFDVVRSRLHEQATKLGAAVQGLDAERRRLFGAVGMELVATHRVRTVNSCLPRDLVHVMTPTGGRFVLGFEVVLGLRSRTTPADVFTELAEVDGVLDMVPATVMADPQFERDFGEVFQYHKDARLLHLRRTEEHLLAVFQAGQRLSDVKVLRFDLDATASNGVRYRDNRGDRDYVFPTAQDFVWTKTTREQHVLGAHPHINIADTVFVECVGGDLTIKVEDNTKTGQGIYAEPVDNATQGLDDAEIFYALLESAILLKVKPYQETVFRYLVYDRRNRTIVRIDEIGLSCQQLPEGHGLIFPGGAWLADGRLKRFPVDAAGMEFKRVVRAPNGEDLAYVFYRRDHGTYLLLLYNLITRELGAPIACHSWCRLPDGRVFVLRAEIEPGRIHTVQVWNTPFCADDFLHPSTQTSSPGTDDPFLTKLGNRELVRAVSDLLHLQRLATATNPSRSAYEGLLKQVTRCLDAFPWLDRIGDVRAQVTVLKTTAEQVIDEFEKVRSLTDAARARVIVQVAAMEQLLADGARADRSTLEGHVQPLARMRSMRGQWATIRSERYVDLAVIATHEARLDAAVTDLSGRTVEFLLVPESLRTTTDEVAAIEAAGSAAKTVAEAAPLLERLSGLAAGLDALVDLVATLAIADQTRRTDILERIAVVYAAVGRAKAVSSNRRVELGQAEGRAAFAVQVQLLAQGTANGLSMATDPARCDDQVARLLIQLEELEGRFGEFPEFIVELATRRTAIADGFSAHKQRLLDAQAQKTDAYGQALERILATITRRCGAMATADALNAYLVGDPLVDKARALIAQLKELGATVAAGDAEGRLKTARDTGMRRLRDAAELFDADGGLKLGRHRFSVNRTPLELTLLARDGSLWFHLTGTEYERAVQDPELVGTEACWNQISEAETDLVYRSEYLAWSLIDQVGIATTEAELQTLVRAALVAHPEHGYERGVHDHDAVLILGVLIRLRDAGGLLRYGHAERAAAQERWAQGPDETLALRCSSLADLRRHLGDAPEIVALEADIGSYLFAELARNSPPCFVRSHEASVMLDGVRQWAHDHQVTLPVGDTSLLTAWVRGWATKHQPHLLPAVPEAVAEVRFPHLSRETVSARTSAAVVGLLGTHPRIQEGRLEVRLDEMAQRLTQHLRERVPAFRAYQTARTHVMVRERERLRLDEFRPQVLSSFVRNALIDEVLLPRIGDNLAKQIGALDAPGGDSRRTDLQGLLLLISPPGYGKTTLMEYLAVVLGLVFVKVNGPTLGHEVTSLDPAAAPNAAARQEVERINLAFALGSNVLLYLDDIQHTNPELLQKFISLCDGQRKVEGVWEGRTKTFDLRGKRVVVCMAGNPYTETGAKFRIPDMLANRADICNIGDAALVAGGGAGGGAASPFARSYIDNALVAHPILKALTTRPLTDVARLLAIAGGDDTARSDLSHPYAPTELTEIIAVLRHLQHIQRALMTVNQAYIASASQSDEDRVEPPFKLQGSYRDMGKLTARVVPAHTPAEIDHLLRQHYRQEAQTLTHGAEANVLKLHTLLGWPMSIEDQARWEHICRGFARRTELGGDDNPARQAVIQLAKVVEALAGLREAARSEPIPPPPVTPAPKVEIINTLPAYYAKLYEHHLHVLETSLIPVLDLLGRFAGNQAKTRAELEAVADEMRTVLSKQRRAGRIELDEPRVEE